VLFNSNTITRKGPINEYVLIYEFFYTLGSTHMGKASFSAIGQDLVMCQVVNFKMITDITIRSPGRILCGVHFNNK